MSLYELKIKSESSNARGKTFKSHYLNGENVIGVDHLEPFSIHFQNNNFVMVQARVLVDGINVLTGKPSTRHSKYEEEVYSKYENSAEPKNDQMFVVSPFSTLDLKAWAETNEGGSSFIFGDREKGVAVNTSGETSMVGKIIVEVYEERPILNHHFQDYVWYNTSPDFWVGSSSGALSNNISAKSLRSAKPAVGASDYVKQVIGSAPGLVDPILGSTLCVRYEWWDKLNRELEAQARPKNFNLNEVPKQPVPSWPKPRGPWVRPKNTWTSSMRY